MRRIALFLAGIIALFGAIGPAGPTHAGRSAQPARHGLGLKPERLTHFLRAPFAAGQFATSIDLSQWDEPIGDQGQVGSCVSWAEGYYYMDWLLAHDAGITIHDGMAPMWTYSQITHDPNAGSTLAQPFQIIASTGDVPADLYSRGLQGAYYDYLDSPGSADFSIAPAYTITGFSDILDPTGTTTSEQAIKGWLDSGRPVIIGIKVYDTWENYRGVGYMPPGGLAYYGNHAVMADGYDAQGISGPNQWGFAWGDHGRFHLSWDFVNSTDLFEAMVAFLGNRPAPPTPTPLPFVPTATPSATAAPSPTSTATFIVPTPTFTATPHITPTPRPTRTPIPPHKRKRHDRYPCHLRGSC
jgi:hypothetical protein